MQNFTSYNKGLLHKFSNKCLPMLMLYSPSLPKVMLRLSFDYSLKESTSWILIISGHVLFYTHRIHFEILSNEFCYFFSMNGMIFQKIHINKSASETSVLRFCVFNQIRSFYKNYPCGLRNLNYKLSFYCALGPFDENIHYKNSFGKKIVISKGR